MVPVETGRAPRLRCSAVNGIPGCGGAGWVPGFGVTRARLANATVIHER